MVAVLFVAALSSFLFPSPVSSVATGPPIDHLQQPSPLWNQAILSEPGNGNVVQISPDDAWLYITSSDGRLSKLNPDNGDYVGMYVPEARFVESTASGKTEQIPFNLYCYSKIAFYLSDDATDESYLVYWVLDVPPTGFGSVSSRIIALRHDPASTDLDVLWIKVLPGSSSGTPVVGSDGKFIYLTLSRTSSSSSAPTQTTAATTAPSTAQTINSELKIPTTSPTVLDTSQSSSVTNQPFFSESPTLLSNVTVASTRAPTVTVEPDTILAPTANITNSTENLFGERQMQQSPPESKTQSSNQNDRLYLRQNKQHDDNVLRHLQADKNVVTGLFLILSSTDGSVLYTFNSRKDNFIVRKHNFAPVGIARRPQYGNYNGGENNQNDVVIWGSNPGSEPFVGETMLFQLPRGFNFSSEVVDTSQFEVKVLESVAWSTSTEPTFSKDGLEVYFPVSGNRFAAWNNGQEFDMVSSLGPVALPPGVLAGSTANRPIVLGLDDTLFLISNTIHDTMFAIDSSSGERLFFIENLGNTTLATTPVLSRDGTVAYFGKDRALYSVNLTNGVLPWGDQGYPHPSAMNGLNSIIKADLSLSRLGDILFYCRGNSDISALRLGTLSPTTPPFTSPSKEPSSTPSISSVPSHPPLPSSSPSYSKMPSVHPSVTNNTKSSQSNQPFIGQQSNLTSATSPPSLGANTSLSQTIVPTALQNYTHPSSSPSALPLIVSPSFVPEMTSPAQTSPPYIPSSFLSPSPSAKMPPSAESSSTPNPSLSPLSYLTPPAKETTPDDSGESSGYSSPLSTTAIIGIAVGCGLVLILFLGTICYLTKKRRGGSDGIDTNWRPSENASEGSAPGVGTGGFQYGDAEVDEPHGRTTDGPLRW